MEQSLAGAFAFTGMVGSCALGLAWLCHVDPFGRFHWDPQDILTGVKFMLPVYFMNLAILFPSYSSWKLPDAETFLARKQAMLAADAPEATAEASGAAAATAGQAVAGGDKDVGLNSSTNSSSGMDVELGSSSSSSASTQHAAGPAVAASYLAASSGSPVEEPALHTFLQRTKDALHLSQGYYLNLNPLIHLPPAAEVGALTVECMAAEMLYRAVALQAIGGWLLDRWYEAGGDAVVLGDVVNEGANAGALQAAEGVALLILAAASVVMVGQRMVRTATRPARLWEAQQQQLQKQREQQKQKVLRLQVPPETASAAQEPQQQQQQQEGRDNVEQQQQRQQRWWELLPTSISALVWSQGVQGVRDISQFVGLGLAYVVTGNLAASYAAAVVNQVLMSWLQRRGIQRTRQVRVGCAAGNERSLIAYTQ